MRNSIAWACSAALLFLSSPAFADDEVEAEPVVEERPELPQLPGPEVYEQRCAPELRGAERGGWDDRPTGDVDEDDNPVTVRVRWFPEPIMQCVIQRLQLLPQYAVLVQTMEQRIDESDEREANLRRQLASAEEGEQVALDAIEAAERRAREAEESRDAWHRSRVLWFVIGVVATGALVALTAYALDATRP